MISKNKILSLAAIALSLFAVVFTAYKSDNANTDELYEQSFQDNYAILTPKIPNNIMFCGEPVPIDLFHVRERLDREILVNVYWQSNTMLVIKRANRWLPIIEKILKEENVPDDFKYLAVIESNLMPVVSSAGAAGFWQFIKSTAELYGLEVNDEVDERYNVEKSTRAACRFLKKSYEQFGSWTLAAAAYNTGAINVSRHINQQKVNDYYNMHLPEETLRYVFRILAMKLILEHPQNYGFYLRQKDLYPDIPCYIFTVDTSINSLFDFALQNGTSYRLLKMQNLWMRSNKLTNKSHKLYEIQIPKNDSVFYSNLVDASNNKWVENSFSTD